MATTERKQPYMGDEEHRRLARERYEKNRMDPAYMARAREQVRAWRAANRERAHATAQAIKERSVFEAVARAMAVRDGADATVLPVFERMPRQRRTRDVIVTAEVIIREPKKRGRPRKNVPEPE